VGQSEQSLGATPAPGVACGALLQPVVQSGAPRVWTGLPVAVALAGNAMVIGLVMHVITSTMAVACANRRAMVKTYRVGGPTGRQRAREGNGGQVRGRHKK
jgi:hypothetical protein